MKIFNKQCHPPGTAPGTLSRSMAELGPELRYVEYDAAICNEGEVETAEDCRSLLGRGTMLWLHVQGAVPAETLQALGDLFDLPQLALEDIQNKGQRAKVEEYGEQLFVVAYLPVQHEDGRARLEQVSLFVRAGLLVSFAEQGPDPFGPVRQRLGNHSSRLRAHNSDFLMHTLLDRVIDGAFPVLEHYGETIERLEDELMREIRPDVLGRIHELRRDLLLLRRALWPQRDVLNLLYRGESSCIGEASRVYLRDCYDHTAQIIDLLESYREMAASLLEVYLSSVSNRLNESMRLLTAIATVFIPLTFIVSVYRMSFGSESNSAWAMPELRWAYGYPAVWGLMAIVTVAMLYVFKRRRWF